MVDLTVGSLPHTVLLFAVSEPGQWTTEDISLDLPDANRLEVERALRALVAAGMLHVNSTDGRIWPLREGKRAFQQAS